MSYASVPINTLLVVLRELELKGSIGYTTAEFDTAMSLMAKKVIQTERFVSSTVNLDGVQAAFERLSSGEYPDVKILIQPLFTGK
ncbi:MAG: hypothetical protein HPY81_03640 [Firmicutes bacterium]|nr:hypothetical protein [Bacillota bacterium]